MAGDSTTIARPYAEATFAVAQEHKALADWSDALGTLAAIVEDLIKLLDGLSNSYRRGRHPDKKSGGKVATLLRAVADDIES